MILTVICSVVIVDGYMLDFKSMPCKFLDSQLWEQILEEDEFGGWLDEE